MITQTIDLTPILRNLTSRNACKIRIRKNTYSTNISFHMSSGPKSPKALRDLAIAVTAGTEWTYTSIGQSDGDHNYVLSVCEAGVL